MNTQENTGYPSIDKPWLKYYSEEAFHDEIPKCTMYEYIYDHNKSHLDGIALQYFNKKITYKKLFENIRKTADAFWAQGIRKGDTVTMMSLNAGNDLLHLCVELYWRGCKYGLYDTFGRGDCRNSKKYRF